jgi:hypothetical protein
MSQTALANPRALVESIARILPQHAQDDFRNLMNSIILDNLVALSPGGSLLQIGGPKQGASAPPVGVTHQVQGANGVLTVSIANPPSPQGTTVFHEFSYSPIISFTKRVTTLPPTQNTAITIPAVGGNYYCRLRSSYDKKTWSPYTLSSTRPIDAGFVESSAMSPGAAFNQTNFAVVSAASVGIESAITINGTGGQFTPYTAIKGTVQSSRPAATIIAPYLGPNAFVGWDGSQYQLKSTLAAVLADDLEPVGAVIAGAPGGGGTGGGNGGRVTAV